MGLDIREGRHLCSIEFRGVGKNEVPFRVVWLGRGGQKQRPRGLLPWEDHQTQPGKDERSGALD